MKTILKNKIALSVSFALLAIAAPLFFESCSKSSASPPTPVETNTKLLTAGTWKIQTVVADGVDKTSSFTGMSLSFTSTSFTTVKGNIVWPASGTWSFTDANATAFTRDDGVQVSIKTISSSSLVLGLTWTKTTLGGRASSIAGQYVFTFAP